MAGPFDYVKSISHIKDDIMTNGDDYLPWIINKALSHHSDTVYIANEANKMAGCSNRMQYDFLRHIVRRRKRFGKWPKATVNPDVALVAAYFGFSEAKALEALSALSDEDLKHIREQVSSSE